MLSRYTFSLLFCLTCFGSASAQQTDVQASQSPNILWIIGEDFSPELGIYRALGNALATGVRTPNLDSLARRGMLFTRAFTTSPVCSPSRSAFMTGMYQTSIGAHNHRSHRADDPSPYPWPLPDSVRLVTDWLRHAGYFTGNIERFPSDVTIGGATLRGTGKTDWNFSYDGRPFDTDVWSDLKANQPFYAQVNFPETHRGRDWDIAHTVIDHPADPDSVVFPPYYPDHDTTRADWAQYLNAAMALDKKAGLVLDLLEKDGLAENTIVVFMGDHGRAMIRGKQWPYDSGLRVPLVVYLPERYADVQGYRPGSISGDLIASIDVTATTLALAGVPKPEAMQGRVFLTDQQEPPRYYVFGGRDRGDETVDRIRTVRTKRFRYLRNFYPDKPFLQQNLYKEASYPVIWLMRKLHEEGKLTPAQAYLMNPTRPEEELYDLLNDPYEIHNLADSSAYQEILGQMRRELDEWIEATGDQGRTAEDPAVADYYEQRVRSNYDERLEALRQAWGVEE